MEKFSALAQKVKYSSLNIFKKKSNSITTTFIDYNSILLKTYFEVANAGNFQLLQLTGPVNLDKCIEVWEDIIRLNEENNGSFKYIKLLNQHRSYNKLVHKYLSIKAMLCQLCLKVDVDIIKQLRNEGYIINTSNSQAYKSSIISCFNKSNSLITKISIKQNEINPKNKNKKVKEKPATFEQIMAQLTERLGFIVPDNITLARYNEYNKIIRAKEAAIENERRTGKK